MTLSIQVIKTVARTTSESNQFRCNNKFPVKLAKQTCHPQRTPTILSLILKVLFSSFRVILAIEITLVGSKKMVKLQATNSASFNIKFSSFWRMLNEAESTAINEYEK